MKFKLHPTLRYYLFYILFPIHLILSTISALLLSIAITVYFIYEDIITQGIKKIIHMIKSRIKQFKQFKQQRKPNA